MVEHSREVGSPRARLASGDSGLGTLTFVATTIVATVTATITAGIITAITIAAVTIAAVTIAAGITTAITIAAGIAAAICRITTRVRRFAWIRVGAISGVATARDGRVTWVVTARDGRVTWVAGESSALAATRTAPTAVVRPTSTTVIASAEYAKP
jgi:hypothetical protein